LKRIDSISERKDEDTHIAIIKEKVIYSGDGLVEWKYEKMKEFIKKTTAGFAAHCKKSIGKISEVIKEIVKRKGIS